MRIAKAEKGTPRPGLLIALTVIAIVVITVWFREGEGGPLHRLRRAVHTISAPVARAGDRVTRPVRSLARWAGDLGASRRELLAIREQNARLRARVAELEEARLENLRLARLLKLASARGRRGIAAHVIGRSSGTWEGVLVIDRGARDGLAVGMPVVGPDGLLGQLTEVSRSTARVRLITDPRSGVAALVQSTRAEGIVKGSIDGRLTLDFVPASSPVRPGDVVITSGIGGAVPKGIVIGEVVSVGRSPDKLQREILVAPASDPSRVEEVLVLTDVPTAGAGAEGG